MKDAWKSPYNAFNSMKVMLWRQHLEGMATGKLLPPVTVDFDPTNLCNSDCIWCNSKKFREQHPESMSTGHMLDLADFLGDWGVKSACVAGGGEPMLNPGTGKLLRRMKKVGVKTGVITNGIYMSDDQAMAIAESSSWCGFSIDSGSPKTFKIVHGVDKFKDVIKNVKKLVSYKKDLDSDVEITYKYLLHPYNATDLLHAAELAKELGMNTFQSRPVCWDNLYDQTPRDPIDFEPVLDSINWQTEKAMELNDENFHFYGIRHKFGEKLERKVNFKKCLATPIMAVLCADGTVQLCHDLRGKQEWILCRHDNPQDIKKVWGSKKHLDMIKSIDPNKCPRCTFGAYNEIIENVIIEDKMYRDFP